MGSLKFYHTLRFFISREGKLTVLGRIPYGRTLDDTDFEIWTALIKADKWGGLDIPDRSPDREIIALIEGEEDEDEFDMYKDVMEDAEFED